MFDSLFGRFPPDDPERFRARVLKVARKSYPEIVFQAPLDDVGVIVANGVVIGLQNLKAKFDLSDGSDESFKAIVGEHLAVLFQDTPEDADFESARSRIKPQLMPAEFSEQAPLITFPFGPEREHRDRAGYGKELRLCQTRGRDPLEQVA